MDRLPIAPRAQAIAEADAAASIPSRRGPEADDRLGEVEALRREVEALRARVEELIRGAGPDGRKLRRTEKARGRWGDATGRRPAGGPRTLGTATRPNRPGTLGQTQGPTTPPLGPANGDAWPQPVPLTNALARDALVGG